MSTSDLFSHNIFCLSRRTTNLENPVPSFTSLRANFFFKSDHVVLLTFLESENLLFFNFLYTFQAICNHLSEKKIPVAKTGITVAVTEFFLVAVIKIPVAGIGFFFQCKSCIKKCIFHHLCLNFPGMYF